MHLTYASNMPTVSGALGSPATGKPREPADCERRGVPYRPHSQRVMIGRNPEAIRLGLVWGSKDPAAGFQAWSRTSAKGRSEINSVAASPPRTTQARLS